MSVQLVAYGWLLGTLLAMLHFIEFLGKDDLQNGRAPGQQDMSPRAFYVIATIGLFMACSAWPLGLCRFLFKLVARRIKGR